MVKRAFKVSKLWNRTPNLIYCDFRQKKNSRDECFLILRLCMPAVSPAILKTHVNHYHSRQYQTTHIDFEPKEGKKKVAKKIQSKDRSKLQIQCYRIKWKMPRGNKLVYYLSASFDRANTMLQQQHNDNLPTVKR